MAGYQSCITASMVSRRVRRTFSDLGSCPIGPRSKPLHPRGDGRHGVKGHAYRPDTLYEVVLRDGGTTGFTKPDGRYLRLCRAVVRLGTPFPVSLKRTGPRGA